MSEVISFRLNKDNLREAKALHILQEWRTNGYSIRQTITEALISLNKIGHKSGTSLDELNEALSQVNHLLRLIEGGGSALINVKKESHSTNSLSTNFIDSVKKSAKLGFKFD